MLPEELEFALDVIDEYSKRVGEGLLDNSSYPDKLKFLIGYYEHSEQIEMYFSSAYNAR